MLATTGWPGAVTRPRLPQNVACRFPALRSSEVDSQRSDSLQLRIREIQLWSQLWEPLLDLMELLPPNRALPTPAAKHFAPVKLHSTMYLLQCPNVSGNAVVRIVTAEHLIEVFRLLPERQVPPPPHLVLQVHQRAPQSRLFRTQPHPKVTFLIAGAVQREAQKVNRLRASTATLARVSLRKATKFDEFGFRLCQGQAKLSQLRTTNAIERMQLEFRRRVKTQAALPNEGAVLRVFFGLWISGQMKLHRINGYRDIGGKEKAAA